MKKAGVKKVLFTSIISGAMLFMLSGKEYAATGMFDQLKASTSSATPQILSAEAGIYQANLSAYMDTDIKINNNVANKRTYYGAKETLKVRLSFSRTIASIENARLGIRFGNGEERVIQGNDVKNWGSYLEFSYTIASNDNGGLIITFVEGTVTDSDGNKVALSKLEKDSTWMNDIVAKGRWSGATGTSFPSNDFSANGSNGGAYILENNEIRKMRYDDVKILNTSTGKTTSGSSTTITINYATDGKAVSSVQPTNNSNIIIIDNICDIAGNKSGYASNAGECLWYVIDTDGVTPANDGKYYFKAGKTIKFLVIHCKDTNIKIGEKEDYLIHDSYIAEDNISYQRKIH